MSFKNKYHILLLAIICTLLWGSAFPTIKLSYKWLAIAPDNIADKLVFAGLRFFIASLMTIGIFKFKNKGKPLFTRSLPWGRLVVLGIMNTALQYTFFYIGLGYASGINGSIITSSGVFVIAILAHFFMDNDRLTWRKISGMFIGFMGVLYVLLSKGNTSSNISLFGEGFLFIAVLLSNIATLQSKVISRTMNTVQMVGLQMLIGSSLLLIIGLTMSSGFHLVFTLETIALLLYASFISSVAFTLWYSIISHNNAGEISVYKLFIPLFGTILSGIVLQENITASVLIGLIAVIIGIVLVQYQPKTKNLH